MPGKKFGRVLVILFTVIIFGILVVDYLGRLFRLPHLFINLVMITFVIAVILIALFLGRSMTSPDEEVEEEGLMPEIGIKKSKQYAWLNPYGDDLRAGYPLTRPLTVIGRESNADILVNDLSVSRKHAQVLYTGGGFILKDLDSNNGTFINNQRIEEAYLADGDMVTFGEMKFVFSCGSIKAIPDHISDVDMSYDIELDLGDLGEIETGIGTGSHITGTRTGTRSGTRFKDLSGSQTYSPDHKKKFGENEDNMPGSGPKKR